MSKIAFVTTEYIPYPGGVATYVFNAAKALRILGHDAQVYVFGSQGPGEDHNSEVPCHQLSLRKYSPKMLPIMALELFRLMVREQIDLWIAADVRCATVMGLLPSHAKKAAILHGTDVVGRLLEGLDRLWIYRPLRHFDLLIANSEFTKRLAIDNHPYLVGRNIRTSLLGVKEQRLPCRSRPLGGMVSIISVGRKEPRKGLEYAIAAMDLLPDNLRTRVTYRIIGRTVDKDYSDLLERMAATSKARVEIMGAVSEADLSALYDTADIFLHPSVPTPRAIEGFGLVLLEASAAGLTVISTLTDAIPEVVAHGKTGLLVPPADPEAIAAALTNLLNDSNLMRNMAAAGVEHASCFTWENHVRPLLELL
ncbi:glycosyltransferase family 4 protein [Pleomorphomonas carboxyditropha]|uniref:Glycosyl transferase family 1 n=1 Tax=Pleomorphomonas carboxyditropha TaxID=2023338 RepID=A0A2G9WR23_9HYPH|nr:glycosyltransferase family 4 protein [Pleomorphomonas carboxyditropha]PIO97171.1 hypothetical protein CJ014_21285 [Pleomorphomonas carboxyditropha]